MNYLKVKNKNHLERDLDSNGIVNNDIDSYNQYLEEYKYAYSSKRKMNIIENDIALLKQNVDEIKTLLKGILNGLQ